MTGAEILAALQASQDPYERVLGDLLALKQQRGAVYNTGGVVLKDYFPFGRLSYQQMIHIKATRCRATLDEGRPHVDSLLDLANYTIFALMAEKAK